MRKTSPSRRISSAIASRNASRTVWLRNFVPSGTSGSRAGSFGAAGGCDGIATAGASLGSATVSATRAGASAAEASSPSSSRTAIGVFTFTPSVPSPMRIFPTVPSSTASNSIVALSVSISAMIMPEETVSPSLTSHLASVPSSMVGERAGIRICVAMVSSPLRRIRRSRARPRPAPGCPARTAPPR